jgi:hypothetical protein
MTLRGHSPLAASTRDDDPERDLVDNGPEIRGRPGELLRLLMRCDSSAPRLARDALRTVAAIDLVRSDAILVVSELVSNAVLHAGCEPGERSSSSLK